MATRERIEMDFRQAMAQADKVDDLAERLSQVSNTQFGNTIQNMAAGWKGENAAAYLGKGARLQNRMNASASDLHNSAAAIRRAARRIYDAEMASLEIANSRSYY